NLILTLKIKNMAPTSKNTTEKKTTTTKSTKSKSPQSKEMKESEFHQFFVDELKDIYWAEKHLAKALPKMQKASTSKELAKAFEKHSAETEYHIKIVEKVFEVCGEKATANKCDAMEGLVEEANSIISDTDKGT